MKKKIPVLIFNIKLSIFITLVRAKLSFMRRDIDEFIKYGVTAEKLDDLEGSLETFANIESDDELVGMQVAATQKKDNEAETLRIAVNVILTRAANKFGVNSGRYRKFGALAVSELTGGDLSYFARRVHRVATGFLSELVGEGLTSAMIDDLYLQIKSYEKTLADQEDAMADRDIATETRTEKANEIYTTLVKYCETGKRIWETKNAAKYNDYVIYDTPSGTPETSSNGTETTTENSNAKA